MSVESKRWKHNKPIHPIWLLTIKGGTTRNQYTQYVIQKIHTIILVKSKRCRNNKAIHPICALIIKVGNTTNQSTQYVY
jgi:hypothetical protein